ncbi:MAG: diphosphate--fructose-6-phosphate 1-phosphotransferase, partial [Chloroflexi bacterium]|nr:diphosphate--fructose-6-phosphate 1-phosphotransferase [Chloroflexota bacterium]
MPSKISVLQQARAAYQPKLPSALRSANVRLVTGEASAPPTDQDQIRSLFPGTYGQPVVSFEEGSGSLSTSPLKVGVVLSGGQAPGGHNVIVGLFDALQSANRESRLYGFLKGPGGVIKGNYRELTSADMDRYRNTGGFDMIMSGRDKIEKPEELAACARNLAEIGLDGLVVIGGDDSNTNAAVLAEYLKAAGSKTVVVGAPKTIDGDMKNEQIEISFGFDTASRVYSELIGNIARDASSAVKYWHFIRLMGRAASHVTLECALQTRPNIALISEEVKASGTTLEQIVDHIVDVVVRRAAEGKHYGVVLVPEGLVEFVDDIRALIDELSAVLGQEEKDLAGLRRHSERVEFVKQRLTPVSARVYGTLP